ncbi:MAG: LamG-like jellyroll fold domain-containing protein [Akkermansiaceae bacterium]
MRSFFLNLAGLCLTGALVSPALAQSPPASFTRSITTESQSVSVNFTLHPIRSANFEVLVQQADGSYLTHAADVPRTYLGTVTGHPGATAIGLLRADDTLLARVSFEDGKTWTTTGDTASASGASFTPAWPTTVVSSGGAGSTVFAAETGIDSTFNHFTACGGSAAAVLEQCEFSVMSTNMVYLRDAAILHRIGKVIVRANAAQDPYAPDGGTTSALLPRQRTVWNEGVPMGSTHDVAAVIHSGANGGLAYVGTIGGTSRYSANDSNPSGDFSVVWRHEAGHNWSSSHYEGGGNPEGSTIMSNNGLSRFSSSELRKIIGHRNSKTSILDNLGTYTFALPPRANQDAASFLRNTPTRIDVLANDSDSNGEALVLLSFDSATDLGGTLARSTGTGPGGRDEILYTPPPALAAGTDWFKYRIQDSSGMQAVGYAMLRPSSEVITLTDHWPLDDATGTTAANAIRATHNGNHENGPLVNQSGANPVTRKGTYYDGTNDQTSIPAPGYNTNTLTFTAWIKRNGTQNANAAILFSRAGSSVSGFHFGSANELRYTWDDGGFTWSSGIVPPDNTWCLAAMCVSPSGTTLHLRTPSGIQSATNPATQSAEAFNGTMYLGWDPNSSTRRFKGWLDDVRVYKTTLTATDIESLYQQALNPPAVTLTTPLAGSSVSPLNVAFAATIGSLPEMVDSVSFVENETTLTTATDAPWQALLAAIDPGSHTVTARAAFGDWGYRTDSAPVVFTALPAPIPVVTVTASLPASKRGPIPGSFTVTRDHPIGELTIGLTIGGTAVPGTDYTALSNSITLPAGFLSQDIVVTPIAAAPNGLTENVVLTLNGGAGHTLGSPSTATLVINDHITSIADGEWDVDTTWNSNAPAPTSGTQNAGEDYSVANTVTSNDSASNSQALVAGSLRVKNGGILDLARLHSFSNQNVSYNLPATAIESGGTIRFRCSIGGSTHTIAAAVSVAGNTTLHINAGSYINTAILSGTLSGNGTIAVLSDSGTSTGTYVRQISVNKANNPFAGNWTVNHTGGGDEFGALRAGAANALGTGTVTVGTRAQLINDNSAGLNSLAGVVLNGTDSQLLLNQPWTNTAASLALTGGTPLVQLGNAASSIGDLSGTVGLISGSGTSSSLTVNSSGDATFAGNLGTNLKFTKSGPAALTLAGSIDPSLGLTLTNGSLALPAPQTIASLAQTGGTLRLALPAVPDSAPLTVSGAFTHSAGNLVVDVTAPPLAETPYTLIRYQGDLTGSPAVTVNDSSGSGLIASVSSGSGSNSSITVTFSLPPPLQFTLNYAAGPNGSLSGEVSQTVIEGNDGSTVTAVPAPAHTFVQWSDGLTNPVRTDTEVSADIAVTAAFAIAQYTLTYSAGPNGSVSGPSPQVIDHGSDAQTVTAVPGPGAFFVGWSDGLSTATRTDTDITAARDLTANFATTGNPVSIANGSSASESTWDINQAAPTSGPQGVGLDWLVENFAVTSNNPSSNAQSLIGGSLMIANNGVLDLARTHDNTLQTVSYNLPPITLNGPATIRFRASNGSSSHLLAAPLTVSGAGTLRITGGNYGNDATLSGPLAGSGVLAVVSESNAASVLGSVRQITISSADNPFTGNWTVEHTASGDDFGALRAAAANALGTGTVTLGTRAWLTNSAAQGIDSLMAVTLNGGDSRLVLSQPWTNPAASLVLDATSAAVDLADAASSIGNLSGTAGTITGTGPSSRLNVSPAADATFGGNFANDLQFTKSGAATLTLTGTHSHTGNTLVAAGTLAGTGSSASALTVADGATLAAGNGVFLATTALFQSGASFAVQLNSNAASSGRLQAAGAVTITAGAALALTDSGSSTLPQGTKLILIDYSGNSLSGNFTGLADDSIVVAGSNTYILDYNDTLGGTGSFVTLTTHNPQPYQLWIDSFTSLTDPADKLPTADPDGDGWVNGVEFVLGSSPANGTSANLPSAVRTGNHLVFTYTRRKDAVAAGFVPEVEFSADLVSLPWGLATEEMTQVIEQETTENVIVTIPLPEGATRFFARLKVTF